MLCPGALSKGSPDQKATATVENSSPYSPNPFRFWPIIKSLFFFSNIICALSKEMFLRKWLSLTVFISVGKLSMLQWHALSRWKKEVCPSRTFSILGSGSSSCYWHHIDHRGPVDLPLCVYPYGEVNWLTFGDLLRSSGGAQRTVRMPPSQRRAQHSQMLGKC